MMKSVIIFHEKHGDRHYIFDTEEQREEICLKIFNERLEEGWYDEDAINLFENKFKKKAYDTLRYFRHGEYEDFTEDFIDISFLTIKD